MVTSTKIKGTLVHFLKLHMYVYLLNKFKVSSIILTSFSFRVIYLPPSRPPYIPQNEPLKSPPGLGLINTCKYINVISVFKVLIKTSCQLYRQQLIKVWQKCDKTYISRKLWQKLKMNTSSIIHKNLFVAMTVIKIWLKWLKTEKPFQLGLFWKLKILNQLESLNAVDF